MVYTRFTGISLSLIPLNRSMWERYTISVFNTFTIYFKFWKPQKFAGQFRTYYQQNPFLRSAESGLLARGRVPVESVCFPQEQWRCRTWAQGGQETPLVCEQRPARGVTEGLSPASAAPHTRTSHAPPTRWSHEFCSRIFVGSFGASPSLWMETLFRWLLYWGGIRVNAKSLQSRLTLCDPRGPWPPRLLCPCDSPGKNTGVGSHALLQGIFPAQELNPLLHGRWFLTLWATGKLLQCAHGSFNDGCFRWIELWETLWFKHFFDYSWFSVFIVVNTALMIGKNIVNKILCLLKNQPSIKTIQQLVLKSL